MSKLYGELQNGKIYILSFDVEQDAVTAQIPLSEYISEIRKLNPQFTKVYTPSEN